MHFVIEEGPIKKWIGVQAEKNTDLEILKVVAHIIGGSHPRLLYGTRILFFNKIHTNKDVY